MSLLPVVILGSAALLLHLALTVAAAPLVAAFADAVAWRRAGGRLAAEWSPPGLLAAAAAPWVSWVRLMRKEPVRAAGISPFGETAPLLSLAATLCAAALVPSFASGMVTAPWADLPTILALLATARILLLLGGLDGGLAGPGAAAQAGLVRMMLAFPGSALAIGALALAAGGTGLDRAVTTPHSGPMLLAGAGLALAAFSAAGDDAALFEPLAGPDLALVQLQAAVQRVIWIDLASGLLLPGTLVPAVSGPVSWLLGLVLWVVRLGLGAVILGTARGRFPTQAGLRRLAGVSVLVGLLAPLLMILERSGA